MGGGEARPVQLHDVGVVDVAQHVHLGLQRPEHGVGRLGAHVGCHPVQDLDGHVAVSPALDPHALVHAAMRAAAERAHQDDTVDVHAQVHLRAAALPHQGGDGRLGIDPSADALQVLSQRLVRARRILAACFRPLDARVLHLRQGDGKLALVTRRARGGGAAGVVGQGPALGHQLQLPRGLRAPLAGALPAPPRGNPAADPAERPATHAERHEKVAPPRESDGAGCAGAAAPRRRRVG
mmetsp:Transcript_12120/g.34161  ORF Transcript_12120/g.34161 Transcript_12120/m.34161 type:complete len:238 (-) Transcript_12120:1126-1839(-)